MTSFQKLWENMHSDTGIDTNDAAMDVIRTGNGLDDKFWDHFLLILNNSDGLSKLLDIPSSKISTWREKIQHVINRIDATDSDKNGKKYNRLIKTGSPESLSEPEDVQGGAENEDL